ncbi:MAG TPA: M20/M25/M40 family metallo-hydrolase [Gemmatimonadaceae bacterium]|jgi:hypothetical protein
MLRRLGTLLGLLVLCAWSIVRIARPPAPVPATAPDTVFSAERAMRHVEAIAARPHAMGTPDHDRVRNYIVAQLAALGLRSQVQVTTAIGTRDHVAGRVQNVLAWMPGSDPSGKALLLVAHYDGVGAGPAAGDDAAGCAALLETLRALRARKKPLAHDVFVLFSDGEESGLLGAAAFVREHPWAKDVEMVLNFEARGTGGRSLMFETGPGNLDAARALRAAGNATAGSVFTTIYHLLPNDTDLSELSVLGEPAMNFAFTDGVERYHTSRDDLAHLDSGSVQHHGVQMLALAKEIGNGPLPRVRTGDGTFFDFPMLGLVVYPNSWALPLAVLALLLVVAVFVRSKPSAAGVAAGVVATLIAVALAAVVGEIAGALIRGPGAWSGLDGGAVVLFALATTLLTFAVAGRWSAPRELWLGVAVLWILLALVTAVMVPGTSYLFVWPAILSAAAALKPRWRVVAEWFAAAVTVILFAGFVYGAAVMLLGLSGPGAVAAAVISSLVIGLILPVLAPIDALRWEGAAACGGVGVLLVVIGLVTVRPTANHPLRSRLIYAEHVDSTDAWLGSPEPLDNDWVRSAVGSPAVTPAWTTRLSEYGNRFAGRSAPRVSLEAPSADLVRDTVINGARRVVLRVKAPGATDLVMRAVGARVLTSSIDGRVVDTTRYRYHTGGWIMDYFAVPDTGAIVALSIPIGAQLGFELAAWTPGLPALPGKTIPPRPANVVPSQTGDVTVVYRALRF